MSEKLVFLSHITEEKDLAKIIKDAIEDEFAGFVNVFVSSDGETIKAGQNFLKVIEEGLVDCIAAIYLISPVSVQRSWISFELGAVWIRNAISQRNEQVEIPALPFCHSGMTFRDLPQPICNLNAIEANLAPKLEFAFKSLQAAVGGRGRLKTDFNALATQIAEFESRYMLHDWVLRVFDLLGMNAEDKDSLRKQASLATKNVIIQASMNQNVTDQIFQIVDAHLSHLVSYTVKGTGIRAGSKGTSAYSDYDLDFPVDLLDSVLSH